MLEGETFISLLPGDLGKVDLVDEGVEEVPGTVNSSSLRYVSTVRSGDIIL